MKGLDADAMRRWADVATADLGAARARIDAVNVFPVPDSDTGTNVYLTIATGAERVARLPAGASLSQVAGAFARGALIGARGNSGVILSQYLDGVAAHLRGLPSDEPCSAGPLEVAAALGAAQRAARAAVSHPVEGTVLTAATQASQGARAAAERGGDLSDVLGCAVEAARGAVLRSRGELAVLRRAGVVDAGAWALVVLLEALRQVVDDEVVDGGEDGVVAGTGVADVGDGGHESWRAMDDEGSGLNDGTVLHGESAAHDDLADGSFGAFEVMFLVESSVPPSDSGSTATARSEQVDLGPQLHAAMAELGHSVAVVGGFGVWQVHVHTDDPAEAVRAGALATQRQVTVRCLDPQLPGAAASATGPGSLTGLGLVVGTRAPALVADLARAGAVVHMLMAAAPSPGELRRAIVDTGSRVVVVLPGDPEALAVARAASAAAPHGPAGVPLEVHVLAAVDDPGVIAGVMAAIEHTAVGGAAELVQVLEGAVASVRSAVVTEPDAAAACAVADDLIDGATQLVTVLHGDSVTGVVLQRLVDHLAADHPLVEVSVLRAGSSGYAFALGAQSLAGPGTASPVQVAR